MSSTPPFALDTSLTFERLNRNAFLFRGAAGVHLFLPGAGKIAPLPAGMDPTALAKDPELVALAEEPPPEDIFTPAKFRAKNSITRIMLFLTDACNLRCSYCHCNSEPKGVVSNPFAERLVQRYLDALLETGQKGLQITFMGGGEPMLAVAQLRQLTARCSRFAAQHGLEPDYVLVTNGTVGSDADWSWLLEQRFRITISSDGPPAVQDCQRPFADGRATSAAVASRLEWLAGRGARVHIRSTVRDATDVPSICAYFQQFPSVETHALEPVSIAGRALLESEPGGGFGAFSAFLGNYSAFLYADPSRFKSAWFKPFKRMDGYCGALYYNTVMTHDGYISLCTEVDGSNRGTAVGEQFLVGHVDEDSGFFPAGAAAFASCNGVEQIAACRECPIRYKCGGGCYVKRVRDFDGDAERFFRLICGPAIQLNMSYLIGLLARNR